VADDDCGRGDVASWLPRVARASSRGHASGLHLGTTRAWSARFRRVKTAGSCASAEACARPGQEDRIDRLWLEIAVTMARSRGRGAKRPPIFGAACCIGVWNIRARHGGDGFDDPAT
jgi:hypothetical protein